MATGIDSKVRKKIMETTQEFASLDEVNRTTTKRLVVDVTAVSGQAFFTGVQRIVREFCEAHNRDLLLVRWDGKYGVFRIIPRLGRLRYRVTTGFWGRLRVTLKNFYWNASSDYREQGRRRLLIPAWVRNVARDFYELFLSDTVLEKENAFHRRPVWTPTSQQTFILLDIPVSAQHISALVELMESGEGRTVVYLHDLFPLSHRALFNKASHPGVRARHLRYLDVVSVAEDVVCNSEFTLKQYQQFVTLTDQTSAQERRVLYPPWPQFRERTDGSSAEVGALFGKAEIRILAVGALDKRKNFVVLVRALELMLANGIDAQLVLVAGAKAQIAPDFSATISGLSADDRDRIEIVHQVSDDRLLEIYNRATVVAVPSLAEGFGLPVVEALSNHRPVVAAATTALVELAQVMPLELASPHDAEEWAEKLLNLSQRGLAEVVGKPDSFPADWHEFRANLLGETHQP
jgi:glycosyltransferase involved in cell wall biosynthesis